MSTSGENYPSAVALSYAQYGWAGVQSCQKKVKLFRLHRHPALLTFYASQVLAKKMAVQGVIVRLQESGSALEQKSIDAEVRNIKY